VSEHPSRIERARRRAAGAKQLAVAAAAASFLVAFLLARASHPGHAASSTSSSRRASSGASRSQSGRSLHRGSASVAPSTGPVAPPLGAAIEAAGYDRDFSLLANDARPPGPAVRGRRDSVRLSGRLLSRPPGIALDLNGVVKALAVDSALELIAGDGLVAAGGDLAARGGANVGLPGV